MATLELKIELPDQLAREAESRGLLTSKAIEAWLRDEIQRSDGGSPDSSLTHIEFEIPAPKKTELETTLSHLRHAHLKATGGDSRPGQTFEVTTDPTANAQDRVRHESSRRNADWLQSHWDDLLPRAIGKFLVVAGQEAFVAETWQDAWSRASAAHPNDAGAFAQYVRPQPAPGTR
jgi:hypothetical protein